MYTGTLIVMLTVMKVRFRLDYRTLEGIARKILPLLGAEVKAPDYTSIHKRYQRLEPGLKTYVTLEQGSVTLIKEEAKDFTGKRRAKFRIVTNTS